MVATCIYIGVPPMPPAWPLGKPRVFLKGYPKGNTIVT